MISEISDRVHGAIVSSPTQYGNIDRPWGFVYDFAVPLHKLVNTHQPYAWGSIDVIPQFLGLPAGEHPVAEVWMGAHPKASSSIEGNGTLLEHLAGDPSSVLGDESVKTFGRRLPFLVKLLAAEKALSVQAHPDLQQAAEGFSREERSGIDRLAPDRTYRDRGHKPELMYALSEFWALCGFRSWEESASDFAEAGLSHLWPDGHVRPDGHLRPDEETTGAPAGPTADVSAGPTAGVSVGVLERAFVAIYSLDAGARREAAAAAVSYAEKRLAGQGSREPGKVPQELARYAWIVRLSTLYPHDVGLLAPLYLNLVHLQPGDALFQPARTLHAYLHGFGVEVMAASDNVVRAGLTVKHVDDRELARILRFESVSPRLYTSAETVRGEAAEFSAWMYNRPASLEVRAADDSVSAESNPGGRGDSPPTADRLEVELGDSAAVVVCTRSGLDVDVRDGSVSAKRGDSFFVDAGAGRVTLSGGGAGVVVRTGLRDLAGDATALAGNPGLNWDDVS